MSHSILIYLDNCTFNRPFDDQTSIRIKLETDAKLYIQEKIKQHELELAWSYMLEFENSLNPYEDKREQIHAWKKLAAKTIYETQTIVSTANGLQQKGLKKKDALHVACALEMRCAYFLTTDDRLLNKRQKIENIQVLNPLDFVKILEEEQ